MVMVLFLFFFNGATALVQNIRIPVFFPLRACFVFEAPPDNTSSWLVIWGSATAKAMR